MMIHYFDGQKIATHCEDEREVYHYTSPGSLLSIMKCKKLWFSDSQFMNDRSEYVYIKQVFKQASKGTIHEKSDDKFVDYMLGIPYGGIMPKPSLKDNKLFSRGFIRTRYYLLCTSLDPDSHSLWNYYVNNNNYQGYNIGIDVNAFAKSISNSMWSLTHGPVNYDRNMQIDQLHNTINELNEQYGSDIQSELDEGYYIEKYQEALSDYLLQRCMFYKNPAFSHENEYRFVIKAPAITTNSNSDKSSIDHHVGRNGLIVPHLEIKFQPKQMVKSITLSPMMEREVAKHGIERLLANERISQRSKIDINFSQIDVRF